MKLHDFTVRGRTKFPLDMLRHDSCWPADGESVDAINANIANAPLPPKEGWRIKLRSIHSPTEGRWASFGWRVESNVSRKL